jgi:predicted flap endonuclease-1-like 5' DNA nuclease
MDMGIWVYVGIAVAVAAAIGLIVWLVWGRKQHVEITRPSLDSLDQTATLARTASSGAQLSNAELLEQLRTFSPPVSDKQVENPDNLMELKGVGPRLARTLYDMGIGHFATIAAWTPEDIRRVDSVLGPFAGRIERDNWVGQAKLLAAGDIDGFTATFGKLGTDVS